MAATVVDFLAIHFAAQTRSRITWYLATALAAPLGAGQLLIRTDPSAPFVRTFSGVAQATTVPSRLLPGMTLLVMMDSLAPEDFDRLQIDLSALPRGSVQVAVLRAAELQFLPPLRTQTQWRTALRRMIQPSAEGMPAYSAGQLYSFLASSAAGLHPSGAGSEWRSVVVLGRFPPLDSTQLEYGKILVSRAFAGQRIRLSYWEIAGGASEPLESIARVTGGMHLSDAVELSAAGQEPADGWFEISWPEPSLQAGFHVYRAELLDRNRARLLDVPAVASSSAALPDIASYGRLRATAGEARRRLASSNLNEEQVGLIRSDLETALAINPADTEALRSAADLYERFHDPKTAARLLNTLAETDPANVRLLAELGHNQFLAGDLEDAEKSLMRCRGADATVSEELARIRLARKDNTGAMPFLDESLKADSANQAVWYLRADTAAQLRDWKRTAESLEKGLEIGGGPLARRTELVRLYLEHFMAESALRHVRSVVATLPKDAIVRADYASFLEELRQPRQALPVWKSAIEIDPQMELAHFRISRLLAESGDLSAAMQAVDTGIAATPQSGRLYLVKAGILERQGSYYQARQCLRSASRSVQDAPMLARLAEMEDASGEAAAQAYRKVAEVMDKVVPRPPEYYAALDRGLKVSLRDNDMESASWFAARLGKDKADWSSTPAGNSAKGMWVRGGLEALAFMAHAKPRTSPARFFVEYCRAIHEHSFGHEQKAVEAWLLTMRDYFARLAALEALGKKEGNKTVLTISISDKKSRQRAEKAMDILGWKLHVSRGKVELQAATKQAQSKRQETASALAIDEVAMTEALRARKSWNIEIPYEWAAVIGGEVSWQTAFYPGQRLAGGLAEAIVINPGIASVYAALSAVDEPARAALTGAIGLKTLAEKYSELIYLFAPAFSVRNGRAVVPGGAPANPVWLKLAGASPANPGAFFRALLDKDEGRVLAFHAILAQLDSAHQRFFTRSPERATRFFDLFRSSPEMARGATRSGAGNFFAQFLRGVPLNEDGTVAFPGSPEVWMVAKGRSAAGGSNKLLKKLARAAAPDDEDEILIRLARTQYKSGALRHSELENFLSVVRVDAHRSEPLEEGAALLLAQHSSGYQAIYSYFAVLTTLGRSQFEHFFAFCEKIRQFPESEWNVILGQLHSLMEMLCLLRQSGEIDDRQAARLFTMLYTRYNRAAAADDFTNASLDIVRELLRAGPARFTAGADASLREMLIGRAPAQTLEIDGATLQVDLPRLRREAFERVLDAQKAPPLQALFDIQGACSRLSSGQGKAAADIAILEAARAKIPEVELPNNHGRGKAHRNLELFRLKKADQIIARLRQQTSKKKVNSKDTGKLSRELLAELNPQVQLALSGVIYAWFLRLGDLVVSEDPLLLRKHQYYDIDRTGEKGLFAEASRLQTGTAIGSWFLGGFSDFATAAGHAAFSSTRAMPGSEQIVAAQIGSLRATAWPQLRDEDLRLAGLRIRLGREWIVEAGTNPAALASLSGASLGLLPLNRRSDLLSALETKDWNAVWRSTTLSELYFLGDRCKEVSWKSPVTAALPAGSAGGSHMSLLGASMPELSRCAEPHLLALPPYEEYERELLPLKLAERVSEFKLYLADLAGRTGIPAAALGAIAEPVAKLIFRKLSMSGPRDWRPVLDTFSLLDARTVASAVSPQ